MTRRFGKVLVALLLVLGGLASGGPADAHTHDGYVNDGDEGDFIRGVHSTWFYVTAVTDIQTDGHCVYWWARVDGVVNTNAYSCGSYDWAEYETKKISKIETQRCITGHWDCDGFLRSYV